MAVSNAVGRKTVRVRLPMEAIKEINMLYVQAKLTRDSHTQTAWIEKKKGVVEGCRVELKEDGLFWTVDSLYAEMEQSKLLSKNEMDKHFGLSIQ